MGVRGYNNTRESKLENKEVAYNSKNRYNKILLIFQQYRLNKSLIKLYINNVKRIDQENLVKKDYFF